MINFRYYLRVLSLKMSEEVKTFSRISTTNASVVYEFVYFVD